MYRTQAQMRDWEDPNYLTREQRLELQRRQAILRELKRDLYRTLLWALNIIISIAIYAGIAELCYSIFKIGDFGLWFVGLSIFFVVKRVYAWTQEPFQ